MTMLSPGSLSQPVILVQSSSQGHQVRPPNYLIILTYINVNAEHKEKAQVSVWHLEQCLVSTKCPSIKAQVFHGVLSAIWIVLFGGFLFDSETKSCYVAQAILEHMIHLSQPPKHWYYINNILGSL